MHGKNVDISTSEITSKQVRGKNVDCSTCEVTQEKVHGNSMDFSIIEISSKKIRGNGVDFLINEIKWKNYVEMTWKFVKIWSLTYRSIHLIVDTSYTSIRWYINIDVESTLIQHGAPVGKRRYCATFLFSIIWMYSGKKGNSLIVNL